MGDNDYLGFDTNLSNCSLLNVLKKLEIRSDESIVDGDIIQDEFNSYLHVERPIQNEFHKKLLELKDKTTPQLILLTGIVGDGKSHLLSYMQSEHKDIINSFKVHSDATVSKDPQWTIHQTLDDVLKYFNDENINKEENNYKLILAINWGTLTDFIEDEKFNFKYENLIRLLNNAHAFNPNSFVDSNSNEFLTIINFSDYQIFELNEEGASSEFITDILNKIVKIDETNPFFTAYFEDKKNNIENSIIYNYEMFTNEEVRESITNLLIKYIIINKKSISTRELLNFIYEILVPAKINDNFDKNRLDEHVDELLPFLVFNTMSRSKILKKIATLSPLNLRNKYIDDLLIDLRILDYNDIFDKYFVDSSEITFYKEYFLSDNFNFSEKISESLLYFIFFFGKTETKKHFYDEYYDKFIEFLYLYKEEPVKLRRKMFLPIKNAISMWKGSIRTNSLVIDDLEHFIVSKNIQLNFSFKPSVSDSNKFKSEIIILYNNLEPLNIDYELCKLILKMDNGYKPNKKEKQDFVVFNSFINNILLNTDDNNLLIYHKPNKKFFNAIKNEGFITFEEELNV